jgi:hypothetical protein
LLEDLKTGDGKDHVTRILENPPKLEEEEEKVVIISDKERLHRRCSSMLDNRINILSIRGMELSMIEIAIIRSKFLIRILICWRILSQRAMYVGVAVKQHIYVMR